MKYKVGDWVYIDYCGDRPPFPYKIIEVGNERINIIQISTSVKCIVPDFSNLLGNVHARQIAIPECRFTDGGDGIGDVHARQIFTVHKGGLIDGDDRVGDGHAL